MIMKTKLLLVVAVSSCVTLGQGPATQVDVKQQQLAVRKQIIVDGLESQIKETPLAAVRVLARYKTATWLWQGGKDETGNAEKLAVNALDELYEKRAEIPAAYFSALRSDLFALLETNAKSLARKLGTKYKLNSEDDLGNAFSLLGTKDGEKAAADKLQGSLANKTELSSTTVLLLEELRSRKSSELPRILDEIVTLEEVGKSDFSAESLFFVVDHFRDAAVSDGLRMRFYKVVCNKARTAVQIPDSDAKSVYDLLVAVTPDIAKNTPELLAEASTLQYMFMSRVSPAEADSAESYRKIEESQDRLGALIAEAEAAKDRGLRTNLLTQAAYLALKKGEFRQSVDLVEKVKAGVDKEKEKRFSDWRDQFLAEVSGKALKADDADAYRYASEKITDRLALANVWCGAAALYYQKKDSVSAVGALDRALKISGDADNDLKKIYLLIRLISTAQKVDAARVPEVVEKTAKAVNAIPRPGANDKPETDGYRKYVSSVMTINERLTPVFAQLVKANKNEALDLSGRVEVKEIKLILNYTLLIDSLHPESEVRF